MKDSYLDVIRCTIHDKIVPSVLAFASESGIDKVISKGDAIIGLAGAIDMIKSEKNTGDLGAFLRQVQSGAGEYTQEELDSSIESSYEKFSNNLQVKLEYGGLCLRRDNLDDAGALAGEVLKKEPSNLRATNLLSRIEMKNGNWDNAIKILNSADKLSPGNPDRLIALGDSFFGKGDIDKALGYYQEAKDANEDLGIEDNGADKKMATARLEQGEVEEAISLLRKSASEDEIASYFNNGAIMASKSEEFEKAVNLYETAIKALQTDRLKPIIYTNMAISQKRLGRIEDAKKSIKKALRIKPDYEKAKIQEKKLSQL